MKLFMQGMRRSGTTIIFDVLSQDPRLDLYYEPFALGEVRALGGGSGVQGVDLMEKTRRMRERFIQQSGGEIEPVDLNYGAPTSAKLELKRALPDYCRDYLRSMLDENEHTVMKFTRMYRKVRELKKLDRSARFVLLTRHPQDVVASYLYGAGQRNRQRYPDREAFFGVTNRANPWSSYKLFKRIIKKQGRPELAEVPNWIRILVLWKYCFDHAYRGGRSAFRRSFLLLRHEDLGRDPRASVDRLYQHMGLDPYPKAIEWAAENVSLRHRECYSDDARWLEAYQRIGLDESLERAGYRPTITGA
jgi:hypothetical protein